MRTTASPRKNISRGKANPMQARVGATANRTAANNRTAAIRNSAAAVASRQHRVRNGVAGTRRTVPTSPARKTVGIKTPTGIIRKSRFTPPPPPPMYWICFDFTVKLVRGLMLGIGIGLFLVVVIPWMMDTGYLFMDKVQNADLALPDIDISGMTNYSLPSWNLTSSRLWRVDQSPYLRGRGKDKDNPPAPATVDPNVLQEEQLFRVFSRHTRVMALVHVGFTGGKTLMQACPKVYCKEQFPQETNMIAMRDCEATQLQKLGGNLTLLGQQAQHYFHLGQVLHDELQQSTTFLLTLRNPVERILSIYSDAHPLACVEQVAPRPWGCETRHYWNLPQTPQYTFYTNCFPQLSPEDFAQALMSPWPNITGEDKLVRSRAEQAQDCRWMARQTVFGTDDNIPLAPHMHYNYEYYAQESIWKYQDREIIVVRAEHEREDVTQLDHLLRGNSAMRQPLKLPYMPKVHTPVVSEEAYHKLCCALEHEIDIYESLLQKAANLPQHEKDFTMEELSTKCGLKEMSWQEWRLRCQNQMEMDAVLLTP